MIAYLPTVRSGYNLYFFCTSGALQGSSMPANYSDWVAKVMESSSVPVLATLLYSFPMLSQCWSLGRVVYKAVWSSDGNLDYLGPKHAPLFIAAVATLLILWLSYTLVLFSGQWLYSCKSRWVTDTRMLTNIKPFLDFHFCLMKSNQCYWYGALLLWVANLLLSAVVVIHVY